MRGHDKDLVSPPLLEGLCCSKKAVDVIYNVILSEQDTLESVKIQHALRPRCSLKLPTDNECSAPRMTFNLSQMLTVYI